MSHAQTGDTFSNMLALQKAGVSVNIFFYHQDGRQAGKKISSQKSSDQGTTRALSNLATLLVDLNTKVSLLEFTCCAARILHRQAV